MYTLDILDIPVPHPWDLEPNSRLYPTSGEKNRFLIPIKTSVRGSKFLYCFIPEEGSEIPPDVDRPFYALAVAGPRAVQDFTESMVNPVTKVIWDWTMKEEYELSYDDRAYINKLIAYDRLTL